MSCWQVIELTEYRASLYDYLKHRMMAIAPNVTALVGELVGARLISHAGTWSHCSCILSTVVCSVCVCDACSQTEDRKSSDKQLT